MKIKQTKHLNSLAANLDTKTALIERTVLKLFKKPGIVKDNYPPRHVNACLSVLLEYFEEGIIINEEYRNELISNISNLEIV
jgi:hypothetical protein